MNICLYKNIRSSRPAWPTVVALCLLALIVCVSPGFSQKKEKLSKTYKEWLDQEVVYIITKEERENFLKLTTDEGREKFVEQFWEVRNPSPGSPTNTFREEFYKRIAFTNARFGSEANGAGWSTDRGRTYITLGEPKSKQLYRSGANLRPIEVWFYSGPNPALPPFFYVLFYQREIGGPYRYYSPYLDGPDKLTTPMESINTPQSALKMIRDAAGPELARISLTLLPDEPVDINNGRPSMESDILLSSIRGFRNLPAYQQEIQARYQMKEHVSSRLLLSGANLDVLTLPVKDSRGLTRLDYAIRTKRANDLTLTKEPDGRYSYSIAVRIRVFSTENKLLFTQENTVSSTLDQERFDRIKDRQFGYLGLLPLAPGKYRISFELTDWYRKASYETSREITIPSLKAGEILVPAMLPFESAEENLDPELRDLTPFSMGGVRFTPSSSASPSVTPSSTLQLAYQIWSAPEDPRSLIGKKLLIEYGLGQPSVAGTTMALHQEVAMEQFDPNGSLVSGKKLTFEGKPLGNYVLTLTTSEADSSAKAFATMHLHVIDDDAATKPSWDVDDPDILKDSRSGVIAQQRGLSLLAQGQGDEARKWLVRALALDHQNDGARAALVDVYFSKNDYAAIKGLYADAGISSNTDSQTLTRIAISLQRAGNPTEAYAFMDKAIASHPGDGALCLALADLYKQAGNLQKAEEWEKRGKGELGIN
jgi:GWxTD domain-containing protein